MDDFEKTLTVRHQMRLRCDAEKALQLAEQELAELREQHRIGKSRFRQEAALKFVLAGRSTTEAVEIADDLIRCLEASDG